VSTLLRRAPQQARGLRRIDTILDAAEQELADTGFEGLTTNAIATRANTSIGSLYQYFPNKEAILQALGLRYLDRCRGLFAPFLTPEAAELPMEDWISGIVNALDVAQQSNVGFKELFCNASIPELADADNAMHRQYVAGLDIVLAGRVPCLTPDRRLVCAELCVRTSEALMALLAESSGERRVLVLAEIKALLTAYLERLLGEQSAPQG
jgi:AcrR family transcriptional regulator